MLKKNLFLVLLFLIMSSVSAHCSLDSSIFFHSYEARVKTTRHKVENSYYKAVASGLLNCYPDQIIIDFDLTQHPDVRGIMVFQLIEWLEQKNDEQCRALIEQIDDLYHLEFHRLLAIKNINDEKVTRLIGVFTNLSRCIDPKTNNHVFRTLLTKIFLSISTIESSALSRTNKKFLITRALEEIKHEILTRYQTIDQPTKQILALNERDIQEFMYVLESETIRQPFVQSSWVPHLLTFVIASTAITLIALYVPWKKLGYWTRDNVLKPLFEGVSEEHAKAFVKGAARGVKDEEIAYNIKLTAQEFFNQLRKTMESPETKEYFKQKFEEMKKDLAGAASGEDKSDFVNKKAEEIGSSLIKGMMSQFPVVGRWYTPGNPQPGTAGPSAPPPPGATNRSSWFSFPWGGESNNSGEQQPQ